MGVTITVDLGTSSPSDIARAAKFMLEFAGYQDPSVAQNASNRDSWVGSQKFPEATGGVVGAIIGGGPRGSLGEEVQETHGSAELDADAAKLQAMGGNAGATLADYPAPQQTVTATQAFAPAANNGAPIPPVPDTIKSSGAERRAAVLPTTVATLPPPPPGIEVDAQGVPWDARIHAGSRAKIADGTWRQKRNLDPEVYKQVMDELRHTMGVERRAPQPPAPPAPQQVFAPHPPVPPVPPVLTQHDINNSPHAGLGTAPQDYSPTAHLTQYEDAGSTGNEVPPAPFVASATPPAPPISSTPPVPASAGAAPAASPGSVAGKTPTFPELVKRITAAFNAKTMTQADVSRAVQKVGLTALPMLAARPDLVGDVATELGIAL